MAFKNILKKISLCAAVAVMVLAVFLSENIFARAGGGRAFSSAGRSFSGRSFSGPSSFSFGTSSRYTSGRHHSGNTEFGFFHVIIILIIIGIVIYRAKQEFTENIPARAIRRANQLQNQMLYQERLQDLKDKDPDFNSTIFINRVKVAFLKIQQAWCAHDLSDIRAFVSDGIYERFSLQIAEQKDEGVRNHMEEIQIIDATIAQLISDNVFDTLTVRISASAVDYTEKISDGKMIDGTRRAEKFVEYWSFVRKPGAASLKGAGLIEGNCPNCGAELKLNQAAKCESCGSLIKSGEYDWVLSEITQSSEWSIRENVEIPGVEQLINRDPEFSLQNLEDKVSVMFFRQMASWRTRKINALEKIASEEYCKTFKQNIQFGDSGTRTFPGNTAIGKVETLGVINGEKTDTALCLVRWSSTRFTENASGKIERSHSASISNHVFVLHRNSSTISQSQSLLSSAHCPSCGAPESDSSSNSCEYCGAVLNNGENDWVLVEVEPLMSPRINELRRALRQGSHLDAKTKDEAGTPGECISGGAEAAAWMIQVMLADGKIDDREKALINSYAEARGVPSEQIDMLIDAMVSGELEAPKPETKEEAREWLEAMAAMALADGVLADEEKQALIEIGRKLNYSAYDIRMIITKKRTELYQRAQTRIRKARKMKMKSFES